MSLSSERISKKRFYFKIVVGFLVGEDVSHMDGEVEGLRGESSRLQGECLGLGISDGTRRSEDSECCGPKWG